MKKLLIFSVMTLLLLVPSLVFGLDKKDLPDYLQKTNVAIKVNGQQIGSGSLVTRKIGNDNVTFIWTAGHVVDSLRKSRSVIDPGSGTSRTIVEFDDAQLVQELREDGRRVGEINIDAKVIRYSNADTGEDLAVLQVRKLNSSVESMLFEQSVSPPSLGLQVFHCGSPLGQIGSNSITNGIISQVGRVFENKEYNQSSCPVMPGSSGGSLVNGDSDSPGFGNYVGMVVRGAQQSGFTLIVPIRRMSEWAKKVKIDFLLNPELPTPTLEEITKEPIEDVGVKFKGNVSESKQSPHPDNLPESSFKFLIIPEKKNHSDININFSVFSDITK